MSMADELDLNPTDKRCDLCNTRLNYRDSIKEGRCFYCRAAPDPQPAPWSEGAKAVYCGFKTIEEMKRAME